MKTSLSKISGKLGSVKSTMLKIKDCKTLTEEEDKIAKSIGVFFGSLQHEVMDNFELKKIKEIDLVRQAYTLDDGSLVYFRSNTGKILFNTLMGKIRSLPNEKKSILLIDEVSPLDEVSINILQNELKKGVKDGRILLAAIAVPGGKFNDTKPHIVECGCDG